MWTALVWELICYAWNTLDVCAWLNPPLFFGAHVNRLEQMYVSRTDRNKNEESMEPVTRLNSQCGAICGGVVGLTINRSFSVYLCCEPCHGHHRVLSVDGGCGGRCVLWKQEQLGLVQIEHQVCRHPLRDSESNPDGNSVRKRATNSFQHSSWLLSSDSWNNQVHFIHIDQYHEWRGFTLSTAYNTLSLDPRVG